jgi:hypothetical protein
MGPPAIAAEYERRLAQWRSEAARLERQQERLGLARLLLFFATLGGAVWVLRSHPAHAAWLLAAVAAFAVLVVRHARVGERLVRARRGIAHHERNLARLAGRWSGTGRTGEDGVPEGHLYARDLDVVGEGSLFQLLDTTVSGAGAATLRDWLLDAADAPVIRARQQAVAALAPDAELRERVALLADSEARRPHAAALLAWSQAPPVVFGPGVRAAALLGGAAAAVSAGAWALGATGPMPLVAVGTLEAVMGQLWKRRLAAVELLAEAGEHELSLLAPLLGLLEERAAATGAPPALAALGAAARTDGVAASARLHRFRKLALSLIDSRRNGVYAFFAFLLQLRVHRAHAVERCRAQLAAALPAWLEVVGSFEALLALSGYAHEHPADAWPEILDAGGPGASAASRESAAPCLVLTGLGHPLLPEERCVRNDLRLDADHALLMISGSNMSGKSTLLRSAGLAVVLGCAGAPVRAHAARLSPFAVGACLAVHDSLREGASRFWAEITRLRAVDELAAGPRPVIFLLDELLSGTNSHDRLLGARAVLARLLRRGAVGLVTTHDLALAGLAEEFAPRAASAHFADSLREGSISFDYRMRPGVVQRGNALALMRSLGLEV